MKKILLFLFAVLTSAFAMADEVTVYTLGCPKNTSNSSYATYYDVTISDITWNAPGNQYADAAWRIGGKLSSATDKYIYTKTAIADAVDKIVVSYGTPTLTVNGIKLDVYSTAELAAAGADGDISSISATWSQEGNIFTCPSDKSWENRYYRFTWNLTSTAPSSNKYMLLSGIVFTKNQTSSTKASIPTLTKSGLFTTASFDVTITNNESGATVYYTTDGTDPTTGSASFTGESKTIQINATTTVKAMAVVDGKDNSAVASATYTYEESIANTKETAYTTAQAIALIDANSAQLKDTKVYVKGTVSKVDSFNETYGSITYWLDDDAFEVYGGLNNNGEKFESIAGVQNGAEVVVYGIIKKYNAIYEMDKDNWLVDYKAPAKPNPSLTATTKTTLEVGAKDTYGVDYNGDGEFSCQSSDTEVATIAWNSEDTEFTVTALKPGKTTITITASETANYQEATLTYTLTVTEKFVAAAIPFEFDGGKADVTPGKGMTQTGLGNDYSSSPKLKFDTNADQLVINIAEAAQYLHYNIKGNGSNNNPQSGDFLVEESANGESYTTLKQYNSIDGLLEEINIALNSDTRYIRFTYVTKTAGNVALGSIRINNDELSGINTVETEGAVKAQKAVKNGRLVIEKAGKQYNAAGALLK